MNHDAKSLNSLAVSATLHCLTGCAVGEIVGLLIGAALGLETVTTIILATLLAFTSGYAFSTWPLVRAGTGFFAALNLVFAADTSSILTMEIVDNLVMVVIPGAMNAGLTDIYYWISLVISLAAAFVAAVPVNRYLLTKGKGHALIHDQHHGHSREDHDQHNHN